MEAVLGTGREEYPPESLVLKCCTFQQSVSTRVPLSISCSLTDGGPEFALQGRVWRKFCRGG